MSDVAAIGKLPQTYGRYTLHKRLGRGGMAEVFHATVDGPNGFSRAVAVKRILPEYSSDEWFSRMIADEARIVSRLNHPNIVQVLETDKVDGSWYIAFELVEGTDLFHLLEHLYTRGVRMPAEFACYVVAEIAAALDHAHSRRDDQGNLLGIVHRDVSPQNVLISWLGEVKLGDFGIARAAERLAETQAGTIKGKVYYMSPEQARGEVVDHRSDLFSAGILLYELLCTEPMYDADDQLQLLETVAQGHWKWPNDVEMRIAPQLRELVTHALNPLADGRFQTGRQLREAILGVMQTLNLRADRDAFAHWLQVELQRPAEIPLEMPQKVVLPQVEVEKPKPIRWNSSHRLQLPNPPETVGENEATAMLDLANFPPEHHKEALPARKIPLHWSLPPPRPLATPLPPDPDSLPASRALLLLTAGVWLMALIVGTLAGLMARD